MILLKLKKIVFLALFVLGFSLLATPASASQIFFGTRGKEVNLGDKFEVGVFLDTQGQNINAIAGTVVFPYDYLKFEGITNGNSNITFWVQQPKLVTKNTVAFSGVIPGGYQGRKGYVFSLIFTAIKKGTISINSSNEKIYLNDGYGTLTKTSRAPLALSIVQNGTPPDLLLLYDSTPPETFKPQIIKSDTAFNGKNVVIFATQDKGSGIDHYEVMERGQLGSMAVLFPNGEWVATASPYILKDQSLQSIVYVKAVDKVGNEVVAQVGPERSVAWYENWLVWLIAVFAVIVFYIVWRKFKFNSWKLKSSMR